MISKIKQNTFSMSLLIFITILCFSILLFIFFKKHFYPLSEEFRGYTTTNRGIEINRKNRCKHSLLWEIPYFIIKYLRGAATPEYGVRIHTRHFSTKPSWSTRKTPNARVLLLLKSDKEKYQHGCFSTRHFTRMRYYTYMRRYAKYKKEKRGK